jgi:hypothetical protein
VVSLSLGFKNNGYALGYHINSATLAVCSTIARRSSSVELLYGHYVAIRARVDDHKAASDVNGLPLVAHK